MYRVVIKKYILSNDEYRFNVTLCQKILLTGVRSVGQYMVRSRADPTKILTLSVSHAKIEKRNFGDAFYRKGTGKFGRKCCYKRLKDEALNAFTHFFGFVKKASPPTALLRKLVGRGLIQVYERIELS